VPITKMPLMRNVPWTKAPSQELEESAIDEGTMAEEKGPGTDVHAFDVPFLKSLGEKESTHAKSKDAWDAKSSQWNDDRWDWNSGSQPSGSSRIIALSQAKSSPRSSRPSPGDVIQEKQEEGEEKTQGATERAAAVESKPMSKVLKKEGGLEGQWPEKNPVHWQWHDEKKKVWLMCDADWTKKIAAYEENGESNFWLQGYRGERGDFEIDLVHYKRTVDKGLPSSIRMVSVQVIRDGKKWNAHAAQFMRPPDYNDISFQVKMNWGWENMPDQVNDQLKSSLHNMTGEVEVQHDWSNPGNKHKTTWYKMNLDEMFQINPDSGTKRQIRVAVLKILRPEDIRPHEDIEVFP
jgi:hypothetical protein